MSGINIGSVIKGGLVAGLVINVGEFILNGWLLAAQWEAAMEPLGMEQGAAAMTVYIVGAFVMAQVGVWLYAAVRPRLGAGPGTAIQIGLVVWLLACAWPIVGFMTSGLFPMNLLWISLVWELVEMPLAIVAGAWLYKEAGAPAAV